MMTETFARLNRVNETAGGSFRSIKKGSNRGGAL